RVLRGFFHGRESFHARFRALHRRCSVKPRILQLSVVERRVWPRRFLPPRRHARVFGSSFWMGPRRWAPKSSSPVAGAVTSRTTKYDPTISTGRSPSFAIFSRRL